ncbi:MAG: thiamine pyrophosphate-dependent dehydrogenase E1 component subunit alpha [Streptosporangiaceae bacterium]
MALTDERKVEIYRTMYLAQQWELGLMRMIDEGLVSGFFHAGRGQEGTEVPAVLTLRPDDYLLYDHRGCAHMIAKGMDLVSLYGDFLGNLLGSTRGLGAGIVHIADPERGVLGQSGTLGGGHLIAAGAGLSAKLRHTDQVVMNFFGDGAANRGTFHEAANAAGAWKLPVVFIVQNNGWAISTPVSYSTAGGAFAQRGPAYDMPGITVDGMDPFAVYEAAETAVARARAGEGPSLIEAQTVRFRGHFEGDPGTYRGEVELTEGRKRDPVPFARQHLLAEGLRTEEQLHLLEAEVDSEIAEARAKALTGELPGRERLSQTLYV